MEYLTATELPNIWNIQQEELGVYAHLEELKLQPRRGRGGLFRNQHRNQQMQVIRRIEIR